MTGQKILATLFGSELRAKLLRFFLLNPEQGFSVEDLEKKIGIKKPALRKEVDSLIKSGFIKKARIEMLVPEIVKKRKGKKVIKEERAKLKTVPGLRVDESFAYLSELRALFLSAIPEARRALTKEVKKLGKPQVIILAGIFMDSPQAPVDLLIVGTDIKRRNLEVLLKKFEKDLGKDLIYAVMPIQEFEYRTGMNDKFLQELIGGPHEIVLDTIGIRDLIE